MAKIVVIHGRQVVVQQRVGVNELDSAGRCQGVFEITAEAGAGGADEHGSDAFAAGERRVAHGVGKHLGVLRAHRQVMRQSIFDGVFEGFEVRRHRGCRDPGLPDRRIR